MDQQIASPAIAPEEPCAMPRYLPGDVVKTKDGEIGLITEAHVMVNGGRVNWNESLPSDIRHGSAPSYAMQRIPGFPAPWKSAWWEAEEFAEVVLGPLHAVINRGTLQ